MVNGNLYGRKIQVLMSGQTSRKILVIIVVAQFCCTSVWFAVNAVIGDLQTAYQLSTGAIGYLTSAIQGGFIVGTLLFALFTVADRFSPSLVFCLSALAATLLNLGMLLPFGNLTFLIGLRFLTGFMLAGIYPVGMKIASDYHREGLGKALGYLVGALVLGTALPYLVKTLGSELPWQSVIYATSAFSFAGGAAIFFLVPDGPYRKAGQKPDPGVMVKVFFNPRFRSAAFGYFGHMWELYAFWAFVPVFMTAYFIEKSGSGTNLPLYAFLVIGLGSAGCVAGGYISARKGSRKVALFALAVSGMFCLISPLLFSLPLSFFIIAMVIWGFFVIMDSPQFSTLVAQSVPGENTGSALTIVNSIGFFITIISIQLLNSLQAILEVRYLFLILLPGPVFGLIGLLKKK
ncbi:MAG: MFS transporter [Cyclobacteriaceae bacterium]